MNDVPFKFAAERHPVLRTGEREPIGRHKRRLVYERDGYACQICGLCVAATFATPGEFLQLDHVIPWSANGSDRSDNLRTLCGPCNEWRSNWVVADPPRLIGVTARCYWCAKERGELSELDDPASLPRIKAFCGHCGAVSWVPSEHWIL